MNTRTLLATSGFGILLAGSPLYYDDATAQVAPPQVISGGIGLSGMNTIAQDQDSYRLKLVFTEPNGDYLANIGVKIRDHEGQTIAKTESKGPVLLMTLPPGTYTVTSSLNGVTNTEKVKVRSHGLDTYYVRLPTA